MAWDKTKPDGGAPVSQGDDTIRDNFAHIESTEEAEHDFITGSGRHKFGSGTTAARNAILDWVDGSIWFNTDTQVVEQRLAGVWTGIPHTSHGDTAARVVLGTYLDTTHAGKLFSDSDEAEQLYIWDGTAWVIHPSPTVPVERAEIVTGTGTITSSVFTVPTDSYGWGIQAWGNYEAQFNATFPEKLTMSLDFDDNGVGFSSVATSGNKDTNSGSGSNGVMSTMCHWMVLGLTDGETAQFRTTRSGGDSSQSGVLQVRMFPYQAP